jgi:hypothetical protein
MSRVDRYLTQGLKSLPTKDTFTSNKKQYSQEMSRVVAAAIGAELRDRGMKEARPTTPGEVGSSGAERRMSGGIGAKKVDVTWATQESGLLFAGSVKTINWRDQKTGNFQKNLTNRRGDMLFEAVTLHRRYPYSVLFGFLWIDQEAKDDHTPRRKSTFLNAHHRMKMFTGRNDPAGRDEQYERLYVVTVNANPFQPSYECYLVGEPETPIPFEQVIDDALVLIAERNPDFYTIHPTAKKIIHVRSK